MTYVGKSPADIIATAVDTTTGTFSGDLTVDTNTLFVDSANNRVGIGTSSPGQLLHLSSSDPRINIEDTDAGGIFQIRNTSGIGYVGTLGTHPMIFYTNGIERMRLESDGDISFYEDTGTTPKLFWDASTEQLELTGGTGTASLNVIGNTSQTGTDAMAGMRMVDDAGSIGFRVGITGATFNRLGVTGAGECVIYTPDNSNIIFGTNNAERMRITSDGYVLVGSSITQPGIANTSTGISLTNNNIVVSSRASGATGIFNVNTDGEIIQFRKSGSTVGSIGVTGSDILYIANPDGSAVGFNFDGDNPKINPCNGTGSGTDGVADLGWSGGRYKDLYLSGGVYLGGTGSANYLDDYEEGTWTPSVDSGTNTVNEATYTKVGRLVTVSAVLSNFSDTTTASIITISGLPFTVSHQGFGICDGERFDVSLIVAQARTSDSKIALKNGVGSTDFTSVDYADINDGVDVALSFTVTYFTT